MLDGFDLHGGTPEDRRGAERRAVLIPATVRCADGETFPCVLRDMSAGGAKLSIARRYRLPEAFALSVPGRPHDYRVRRVWQRGDFAGIALDLAAPAGVS